MNLAAKRAAWLRDDFVIRLGAFLMVIGLLFSLVNPPKAKAIAVVDDILVVASVFFQACGLTWSLQGAMEQSGFTNAVAGLLTDYLAADFAGQTPAQWAGDIGASIAPGGKLMIPKLLAQKLGAFANWVVQKKAITAGGSNVAISGKDITIDGISINFSAATPTIDSPLTWLKLDTSYSSPQNRCYPFPSLGANSDMISYYCYPRFSNIQYSLPYVSGNALSGFSNTRDARYSFAYNDKFIFMCFMFADGSEFTANFADLIYSDGVTLNPVGAFLAQYTGTSVAIAPKAIDIPDTSTMADNESIAIDTAITAGTTAELLQRILDAIMAGTLTATKEIAKEEPKPGEITDVNELGLPSLKLVLTTRFPFSIPWDVGRAFKLLVAPVKTPYFEVDFMAPIANRFPGGFKGSTKIVLDFEQYAIIGTVSRWTSTIGFCLALAGGTKRLIWVG